jgi:hypothetical protein
MFKKSTRKTQLDAFSSADNFLNKRAERFYSEPESWHNLFRVQVTMRIDELLFKDLYSSKMGSPNASVRTMVGMMIIKEANGWSDAQLFEQCRFNILVRSALGLVNMNDPIPTESTYYLFRSRIVDHERQGNPNLLEQTFASITTGQAVDFQVSGRSIRMDSKLLGSNIAWLSRYELVHETLRLFCSESVDTSLESTLTVSEKELLSTVISEKGNKVVYRSSGEEVRTKLVDLGILIYKILQAHKNSPSSHYGTLSKVFADQFDVSDEKTIIPKPKESIAADSIQSPHDTDCNYRNKDGNQVKGYSVNVTESCDKEGLNLISSVDVKTADAADNDFLKESVQQAAEIFNTPAENIHTDGAYHSPSNQAFAAELNAEIMLNAIQGPKGRYDLMLDESGELTVMDLKTNLPLEVLKTKSGEKWRIKVGKKYRYFRQKEIVASELRRKIASIPQEVLNVRNNVEATIFQLGYHYSNAKTRYRGLIKHKMWANIRCLWVNFVRIVNHVLKNESKTHFWLKKAFLRLTGALKIIFSQSQMAWK